MPRYIGLDLGGTNIKAAVLDESGRILAGTSVPTNAAAGPGAVIAALVEAAGDVARQAQIDMADIDAIGVGSPGPIDLEAGVVLNAPNLPDFINVPLRDSIAEATGRPTVLDNDANVAAFGEYWAGAARGADVRDVVMLTLGTGIGSGLIVDGHLVHGAFGHGGEAGHIIVVPGGRPCGCGQQGCLEAYASASRTARRAEEAIVAGDQGSMLAKFYEPLSRPLTAKQVFDAANVGDELALRIVDETATYLGIACVNLCRLLDPQMILFAGGMILSGDLLFDRIRKAFAAHTWGAANEQVRIEPASLGNDAGVIGAGGIAREAHRRGCLGPRTADSAPRLVSSPQAAPPFRRP